MDARVALQAIIHFPTGTMFGIFTLRYVLFKGFNEHFETPTY